MLRGIKHSSCRIIMRGVDMRGLEEQDIMIITPRLRRRQRARPCRRRCRIRGISRAGNISLRRRSWRGGIVSMN